MLLWPSVWVLVALGARLAQSQSLDEADYTPIVVPLAVRSPYLGAYLQGRQHKRLSTSDPRFWTTTPLGWKGLLRVDGKTWTWMGNATDYPPALNASFVHTTAGSKFVLTDDPPTVSIEANFVSPVTPADLFRQSVPFSYLDLTVASLDARAHSVQVYTELDGLWLADNEGDEIEWESKGEPDWRGIRFRLKDQRPFEEEQIEKGWTADRILSGDVWYAARASKAHVETSFAAGDDAATTRRTFATDGSLANRSNHTAPRTTRTRDSMDASRILDEPVFAFAHDFGSVSTATSREARSQLVTIGHVRDPLVQYMTRGNETVPLRPLWRSTFPTVERLISFFLGDYANAVEMSAAYNKKLYADARKVDGQEYAHVVSISTRQVFAALEAVWDESDEASSTAATGLLAYSPLTGQPIPTMVMLKEVSSNGNCGTVDVLAPFLPFMLYASPSLIPLLLEPTLRYAATGLYAPIPPPHDIGDHYPACIGHNDFLYPGLPIEEAGNMLNMVLAGMRSADAEPYHALLARPRHWFDEKRGQLARAVGWHALVGGGGRDHRREGARASVVQAANHYELLKTWADYLVDESLFPRTQIFGPAPNQTSLVIKGITGIRSMSEIAADLGNVQDSIHYRQRADAMRDRFLELAVAADGTHLVGQYGNDSSWMTHYNLYYDKLLTDRTDRQFPEFVYDMQDAFYPTVAQPFGPPLDSRFPARAKTDWLLWAAGAASPNSRARRVLVDSVARYFRADKNAVFGDAITPGEGWSVGFLTRPVAGGHYSLLALDVLADERNRRRAARAEWRSRDAFVVAVAVAVAVVGVVGVRQCRRRHLAEKGYREVLGTARTFGRRFSSGRGRRRGGGEEAIWLAETPEQGGSVFDLGGFGDDDDEDDDEADGTEEEEWAKRRIGRRSSSIG
ncbi:hypothetical protein JCM11491_006148 [Sporobolomyces phaffii]